MHVTILHHITPCAVAKAAESLSKLLIGVAFDSITANFAAFWRKITSESQLRWVRVQATTISSSQYTLHPR